MVRHAKSDWSNPSQNDFDRTLNARGLNDAPVMGSRLSGSELIPDLIVSSTAKRAAQTALMIAKQLGYEADRIQWTDELYHASAQKITAEISVIDDACNSVMIVCHNPGITHFVNMQCGFVTDNVPTCGMTAFEIETDTWTDFIKAGKRLLLYDFPKNT